MSYVVQVWRVCSQCRRLYMCIQCTVYCIKRSHGYGWAELAVAISQLHYLHQAEGRMHALIGLTHDPVYCCTAHAYMRTCVRTYTTRVFRTTNPRSLSCTALH